MKIEEICGFVNQSRCNTVISKIVSEIEGKGCRIMPQDPKDTRSSHSFPLEGKPYIRIYFGKNHPRNDVPLRIIWDMLHEYGHFLTGPPIDRSLPTEERNTREVTAWQKGYPYVVAMFTPSDLDSYKEYANYCLHDYRIKGIKDSEWEAT